MIMSGPGGPRSDEHEEDAPREWRVPSERSGLAEGQDITSEAIAMGDGQAVRALFANPERRAGDELGDLPARPVQRIDLVLVAMQHQRRHRDGAQLRLEIAV